MIKVLFKETLVEKAEIFIDLRFKKDRELIVWFFTVTSKSPDGKKSRSTHSSEMYGTSLKDFFQRSIQELPRSDLAFVFYFLKDGIDSLGGPIGIMSLVQMIVDSESYSFYYTTYGDEFIKVFRKQTET